MAAGREIRKKPIEGLKESICSALFHTVAAFSCRTIEAEREGFEPSVPLRVQRFSRPSRSTTPAPLRTSSRVAGLCQTIMADISHLNLGSKIWKEAREAEVTGNNGHSLGQGMAFRAAIAVVRTYCR